MLIGEIVTKSGLSRDTIRFYEKKGLINVERTDTYSNNYKFYNDEVLNKLLLIKKAKSFGFTLNEVAEIIEMFDVNEATCEVMEAKVKQKLDDIEKKIQSLNDMKKIILARMNEAQSKCALVSNNNCQIL